MPSAPPKRRLPAAARRALIVDAALKEFAAHGYEGASMRRIGQVAGVTRTVLYDHFASKGELFGSLLEDKHAILLWHLEQTLTGEGPMGERMRATMDTFFAFAEREPLACRLLFPEHAPVDPEVAEIHRRHRASANRALAVMLEPDARRAGLDPASPVGQAVFALYLAALHGAVGWWHAHPDIAREQVVEGSMSLLWTGLGGLESQQAAATVPPVPAVG